MATIPYVLPNAFSAPRMEYPFLSELQLLNTQNYTSFVKKYPQMRDYYVMQLEAEGALAWSPTKNWKQWVDSNKDLPAFRVTANASGAAGAEFTVTLTAASHIAGKLSPIGEGQAFVDDFTNSEYEVVSVNKSTDSAHTVTLRNTDETATSTITAADSFLKYMGKPFTEEGSTQRDGMYRSYETADYDMTIIREDRKYTDSTKFEILELDGKSYYNIDQQNLQRDFLHQQELELMINGRSRTNVGDKAHGNQNTNHQSLLNQALDKGLDMTATNVLSDVYFEDLSRINDSDGYTDTYDVLTDNEFLIQWQKFMRAQNSFNVNVDIQNGNQTEIQAVFDYAPSVKYYGITYNIKKYGFLNSARIWGADPQKSFLRGTAIFIPKGEMYNPLEGDNTPLVRVRYNSDESGKVVWSLAGGGLVGQGTDMVVEAALVTHKGIEVGDAYAIKVGRIRA